MDVMANDLSSRCMWMDLMSYSFSPCHYSKTVGGLPNIHATSLKVLHDWNMYVIRVALLTPL